MKVSVIVPVYNTESYLRECIDSLLNQTLREIEILLIDDGSTDSSGAIIDEYALADSRIKAVHKKNGGQATARNIALKMCKGEYIGFLDSDDYVKTDMFEKLYRKAEKEHLDYVGCGYTDFTVVNGKRKVLVEYVGQKPCDTVSEMFRDSLVSPFINLFKRSAVENAGAYFPEGVIYEDTAFLPMVLPYISTIGFVEESLAYRRRRSNSTMTITRPDKVEQIFPVLDALRNHYKLMGQSEKWHNELEYFCIRILLCSSIDRISRVSGFQERRRLIRKTWIYIRHYFPEYKGNPYFSKSKKDIYMKVSSYPISILTVEMKHRKKKMVYE